jgi:hypothetical protein
MATCLSRITKEATAQHFGNKHNKFYIEYRCNLPCVDGSDVCVRCSLKSDTCKQQTSPRFPHGKVNEPIPDGSHIFGGKWYLQSVSKYQTPTEEVLTFARKHQEEARNGFDAVVQPDVAPPTTMKIRLKPKKKSVKGEENTEEKTSHDEEVVSKPKKGKQPSIKLNPYSSLVQHNTQLVYKEVTIPTYLEKTVDEIDADEFDIEYVTLKPFEHNGTLYFRDAVKNKLYKNLKQKVGDYVGRYHPMQDCIYTDIPDSDAEGEN